MKLRKQKRTRRNRTNKNRIRSIEGLETRSMMSADFGSATFDPGPNVDTGQIHACSINFQGTNQNDTITLDRVQGWFLSGIRATINGSSQTVYGVNGVCVHGLGGADRIVNNSGFNITILGGDGNDSITGGTGSEIIDGGAGNDWIFGGDGDDNIKGGTGDDTLYGRAGNDRLDGQAGNDTLVGDGDWDPFFTKPHNDTLIGGPGNDRMYGNEGADKMYGNDGADQMFGGNGNDQMYGGNHHDRMYGDGGIDMLRGEAGNDELHGDNQFTHTGGNAHRDTLLGGSGNDRIYGEEGDDWMWGESGNDYIAGGDGNDFLDGGSDHDSLRGHNGVDRLYGRAGIDYLDGGEQSDLLDGGTGKDSLYGRNGNDRIIGVIGEDHLNGGNHNDRYEVLVDFDRIGKLQGQAIVAGRSTDTETIVIDIQLGSLVDDVLEPVLNEVKSLSHTVGSLLDFLDEEIPGVSVLSDIAGINGATYSEFLHRDFRFGPVLGQLNRFVDAAQNIPSSIAVANQTFRLGEVTSQGTTVTNRVSNRVSQILDQNWMRALQNAGFQFDVLQNPAKLAEVLYGNDVNLIAFDLPDFDFHVESSIDFDIPIPLIVPVKGEFGVNVDFDLSGGTIGYDTAGLKSGDLTDGFFVTDTSLRLEIDLYGKAYATLGVVKGGVDASVGGFVDVSARDTNGDGKARIDEFQNAGALAGTAHIGWASGFYYRYLGGDGPERPDDLNWRGDIATWDIF